MGTNARRVGTFVPWVALAAVSVFALVLLGQRRAPPPQPEPKPQPQPQLQAPVEAALDDALQENLALEGRVADLLAERDQAVARAEAAEAASDVQQEKVAAYDATLGEAEEATRETEATLEAMRARVVSLEARREAAQDPVLRWLRDVVAADPERQAQALEGVARAKAGDLERFAVLVEEDEARAQPFARLLHQVEPSDASDGAVAAVLLAGGDPRKVGPTHVVRPAVIQDVLEKGNVEARRALLNELILHAARIEKVEAPLPILAQLEDGDLAPLAARLVGILRLEGAAVVLASKLDSDAAPMRAAAAYALSRIPDREPVDAAAKKALPALLDDASLEVRTAAVLLAEAVLGRPVVFDPGADADIRAGALRALVEAWKKSA